MKIKKYSNQRANNGFPNIFVGATLRGRPSDEVETIMNYELINSHLTTAYGGASPQGEASFCVHCYVECKKKIKNEKIKH